MSLLHVYFEIVVVLSFALGIGCGFFLSAIRRRSKVQSPKTDTPFQQLQDQFCRYFSDKTLLLIQQELTAIKQKDEEEEIIKAQSQPLEQEQKPDEAGLMDMVESISPEIATKYRRIRPMQ